MKRRKFILSLAGSAAAGLTGWKLASSRSGGSLATNAGGDFVQVKRTAQALGTTVQLTVYHRDAAAAEAAIDQALAELRTVESVMSLYRSDSQVVRLNTTGELADPHPYLVQVLREAQMLAERSGGAFDVTVQPLWELYYKSSQAGALPAAGDLAAARAKVGWRRLEVSDASVRLRGHGTAITLNGIAQGFAADVVKGVFESAGVAHALIDTGEIDTLGSHVVKDRWTIGIKHPRRPGELLGLAGLQGRSLATSGDYETTFDADFRHHHLLDARTGDSPAELSSVSIVAPSGLQADALSTAVFVMGSEAGRQLVEAMPGVDALFVSKSGTMEQTAGFPLLG